MRRTTEIEVRNLMFNCPFGVYNGKLIIPRHMSENEIVSWVERIYAVKEQLLQETEREGK